MGGWSNKGFLGKNSMGGWSNKGFLGQNSNIIATMIDLWQSKNCLIFSYNRSWNTPPPPEKCAKISF